MFFFALVLVWAMAVVALLLVAVWNCAVSFYVV